MPIPGTRCLRRWEWSKGSKGVSWQLKEGLDTRADHRVSAAFLEEDRTSCEHVVRPIAGGSQNSAGSGCRCRVLSLTFFSGSLSLTEGRDSLTERAYFLGLTVQLII